MKMRKLFAGLAAAATLLGGLALGASTANADTNVVPNNAKWPTAEGQYPATGTTITIKASNKEQLQNRTFRLYKLADYVYYKGQNVDETNLVKGSVGLQTVGWNADSSKTSAAYKKIQAAVAAATANNADITNQYAPKDASGKAVNRPDDPLAWAAQSDLKTGDKLKSNGRIDQSPTSPWTGLTRQLAEAFNLDDFATGSDKVHHGTVGKDFNDKGKAFDYYDAVLKVSTPIEQWGADGPYWTAEVNVPDRGLYFITDATTSTYDNNAGYTNSLRMIVGTKLYLSETQTLSEGEIDLKNQTLPIHKEVVNQKTEKNKTTYESDETPDYSVGDTIYYRLTTQIPTYTGYEQNAEHPYEDSVTVDGKGVPTNRRVLKVMDTMSKGLTYESVESVTVTPTGENPTDVKLNASTSTALNDYRLTTDMTATYDPSSKGSNQLPTTDSDNDRSNDQIKGKNATKITIDLGGYVNQAAGAQSNGTGKSIAEGGTVTVIIKATLNKDAVISTPDAANGNPNKVDLEYTNSPDNMQNKITVPGGEVNVYTFKFQLLKYAKDAGKQVPLDGAKFVLKRGNAYLTKTTDKDGKVTWAELSGDNNKKEKATAFVSGDTNGDGKFVEAEDKTNNKNYVAGRVAGLDGLAATDANGKAIEYTVEETDAPADYQDTILPSFKFTITVNYNKDVSTDPNGGDTGTTWGDHTVTETKEKNSVTYGITYSEDKNDTWSLVSKDTGSADGKTPAVTFQYNVQNVKNVSQLPLTGAAGVVLFTVVGLLLASAAGLVYTKSRATSRALRRH